MIDATIVEHFLLASSAYLGLATSVRHTLLRPEAYARAQVAAPAYPERRIHPEQAARPVSTAYSEIAKVQPARHCVAP